MREPPPASSSRLVKAIAVIGSAGLLIATATDTLAVIGRHTGINLLGSIEVVQAAIVLLASAAMVLTTESEGHATIQFLTSRLSARSAHGLKQLTTVISLLFCLILLTGCALVLAETWSQHERSDLLHIPFKWLRLLLVVAIGLMAAYFISNRRARGGRS